MKLRVVKTTLSCQPKQGQPITATKAIRTMMGDDSLVFRLELRAQQMGLTAQVSVVNGAKSDTDGIDIGSSLSASWLPGHGVVMVGDAGTGLVQLNVSPSIAPFVVHITSVLGRLQFHAVELHGHRGLILEPIPPFVELEHIVMLIEPMPV